MSKEKPTKTTNIRRQLYKKNRLQGMSAYKAARAAGYAHYTALQAHKNIESRIKFDDLMVKHGLDNDTIMKVLGDGLSANKVISATVIVNKNKPGSLEQDTPEVQERNADGKSMDFIDIPDHSVRHRYLETLLKLKGELREMVAQKTEKVVIIRETVVEKKVVDKTKEAPLEKPEVTDGSKTESGRLPGQISIVRE